MLGRRQEGAYPTGLSGLAEVVLGRPLNKRTRMSDWEQRPLSQAQLHYAALDAACLVRLVGDANISLSDAKSSLGDGSISLGDQSLPHPGFPAARAEGK